MTVNLGPFGRQSRHPEVLLIALHEAVGQRDKAMLQVTELAVRAHEAGATWQQIGKVVRLTRQGAHKRYGPDAAA